jgi:hypothetical protein
MRRFLHCVGAIRCPAPRALRALLQPCIQFCDGLHPQSLSPLHQGYEERAVERACTIGEDGSTHGRRARGDRRRQHGRVDGIIELEEFGELHVTPLGRDVHHHHLFHLLLQRLWRVWLIIGVGVAIGDVAQGHQVTGAEREELRASSLARGSRRHESVGAREAQERDRPLRPTPPHPTPPRGSGLMTNTVIASARCGGLDATVSIRVEI